MVITRGRRTPLRAALFSLWAVLGFGICSEAVARPLSATDLVQLNRVAEPRLSPDGALVAYQVSVADLAANKRTPFIWIAKTNGDGTPYRLAQGSSPRWSPDGERIFYLAAAAGVEQVFNVPACAPPCAAPPLARQVTSLPIDVDSFRIAPNGRSLVISMAVFPDQDDPLATKARKDAVAANKADGKLYDRIFIRHWDTWADGTKNHLFVLALGENGAASGVPIPITKGFDGDVPSKPFGGDEDYTIWPDGRTVLFSARLAGATEPRSTNFDLYAVSIDGARPPVNMTAANKAWDTNAIASPDGRFAAYRAMKRPGFEADRFGVMIRDLVTGETREIDSDWDRSADKIAYAGDGRSLYVLASDEQHNRLFKMDIASGMVRPLTEGGSISDFDVAHTVTGDVIVYIRDAMNAPAEVFSLLPGEHDAHQITRANAAKLTDVSFTPYQPFSFSGWNGETVHGWVVNPYNWNDGKKHPAVLMIHGGPQGSWEDSFSYRWNPQVWAGWGYAVVLVDFHGSTGYGQAFTDAISDHWGDRPLEDLKKGWAAALEQASFIDPDRACAAGASYGGFMTYWIAGVWNRPWRCLIDHDGVFDTRLMGYETEELWFSEWENGGAPEWEKPSHYSAFDPMDHVGDWTKPILVIHSSKDFRIPLDQGVAAFTAAQQRGIPSEFLTFPDENHWVLKPQNSLQWHQTVEAWLKRWIGTP